MKTLNELITEYKNRPKNDLIVSLRYNKTASQELIDKTSFLNSYSDVTISERLYYYINNLTEPQLCPYCNKNKRQFIKLDKGLFATCGSDTCKKQGMSMGALQKRDWTNITLKAKQTYKSKHGVEHNMKDPIFIMNRTINNIETVTVVLNGEKGKVQYIGFRAIYTVEEYEVKMFEQKTGKLIGSSHYKLYKPVYGEFALLDGKE